MIWQDLVLTASSTILTVALVPTLLDKKEKPAFMTSAISGVILFIVSAVYYTLSLVIAALVVGIQGIFWVVLAYQRYLEVRVIRRRKR